MQALILVSKDAPILTSKPDSMLMQLPVSKLAVS